MLATKSLHRFYFMAMSLLRLFVCILPANSSVPSAKYLLGMLDTNDYDKMSAPNLEFGKTTPVHVSMLVESISSFKEFSMDYEMDFYLYAEWVDHRLTHNKSRFIATNDMRVRDALWWPDMYIANAKESSYQDITVPNWYVRVYPDGTVFTSRRIRAKLSCIMSLHNFPADIQTCPVKMLTYMSPVEDIKIEWQQGGLSLERNVKNSLPDFVIEKYGVQYCNGTYSTGEWSCLLAEFNLRRFAGYQLFQVFLPSITDVMVSWIGFWISPRAVPGRVTLSVTTFLALATQQSGIKVSLPPVTYATVVDKWMTTCTLYLFAALLEFALAYQLYEKEQEHQLEEQEKKLSIKRANSPSPSVFPMDDGLSVITVKSKKKRTQAEVLDDIQYRLRKIHEMHSSKVDKVSRVLFPVSFLFITLCYIFIYDLQFFNWN